MLQGTPRQHEYSTAKPQELLLQPETQQKQWTDRADITGEQQGPLTWWSPAPAEHPGGRVTGINEQNAIKDLS